MALISQITASKKQEYEAKSIRNMPDDPTKRGWTSSQIKQRMAADPDMLRDWIYEIKSELEAIEDALELNGSAVDSESTARSNEDTALSNRINTEASTRASNDTMLSGIIQSEVDNRVSAVNSAKAYADTLAMSSVNLSDNQTIDGVKNFVKVPQINGKDIATKEDISNAITTVYKYKGSVSNYADLPTNASTGDTYNVVNATINASAGTNFAWTGTSWDALGGSNSQQSTVDLSEYLTISSADSTYLAKSSASLTYLSIADAGAVYLAKSAAIDTYLSKTDAGATYLSKESAGEIYQTKITVDTTPTIDSANPVSSGGVKSEINSLGDMIDGKQDTLVYDTKPTVNSNNQLTSGTIYSALLLMMSINDSVQYRSSALVASSDSLMLYYDDKNVYIKVQDSLGAYKYVPLNVTVTVNGDNTANLVVAG